MSLSPLLMSSPVTTLSALEAPLTDVLRGFELFAGVSEEQMQWFVDHATDERVDPGTQVAFEGQEADSMTIVIDGQLRYQSSEPGSPVLLAQKGVPTGLLPYSRLKKYRGSAYALTPLRVAIVHRDLFPEMLRQIPQLAPRLVAIMSDRIRETTRLQEQREKLKALGKLAGGLAHELNNPASAAQRAAQHLQRWIKLLRDSNQALAECGFDARQFQCLLEEERNLLRHAEESAKVDSVELSDREEILGAWLKQLGIGKAWEFAPVFVEAGASPEHLAEIINCFIAAAHEPVVARLAATLAIDRLATGIHASTEQITDLIGAVKGYSFVDQVPEQEITLETGLENTLLIFNHRLRKGIVVEREYDPMLPRITANGSELNQVWTNLIDNALDAMNGTGTLGIRTACEPEMVLVEIADTGTGIPREIQDRIFDPFFTTKDVGAGRGLGLDVAFRIVQKHRGDIRFTSQPGRTVFQVRLPTHPVNAF
jgi:signal transduction histidine kinase